MFDVDGTLVKSYEFDEQCFIAAVSQILGHDIDSNWNGYRHVTDSGILSEHLERKNIHSDHEEIHQEVKAYFIKKVKDHLSQNPVSEIPGANAFITKLKELDSVGLSIATGGWKETAMLKLESAGIEVSGIPLASSNDHYSRTEIMKIAMGKANVKSHHQLTYFGDALWDKLACSELGYNFILVGGRIEHDKSVEDLENINQVLSLIGL
ncbi:MAG: phosphoglycolate phosphatase-like HAD superfamily hydrolase [Flavobacterium sp.]|jgi:phosphoglycolate phosphatase-like HAD superfamily hydrolase